MSGEVVVERQLDLSNVLNDLVADGLLDRMDANGIAGTQRNREQALLHPFAYIAGQHPKTSSNRASSLRLRG